MVDGQGRIIKVLQELEDLGAGTYTKKFDVGAVPPGVYLAELSINGTSKTKKFVVNQ